MFSFMLISNREIRTQKTVFGSGEYHTRERAVLVVSRY